MVDGKSIFHGCKFQTILRKNTVFLVSSSTVSGIFNRNESIFWAVIIFGFEKPIALVLLAASRALVIFLNPSLNLYYCNRFFRAAVKCLKAGFNVCWASSKP